MLNQSLDVGSFIVIAPLSEIVHVDGDPVTVNASVWEIGAMSETSKENPAPVEVTALSNTVDFL